MDKRKLVYIAHPSSGLEDNHKKVEEIINIISKTTAAITPISPVLSFGCLYDSMSYDEGMNYCYSLLERCDEMWMTYEENNKWEDSKGCNREIGYCKAKDIPIRYMKFDEKLKALVPPESDW